MLILSVVLRRRAASQQLSGETAKGKMRQWLPKIKKYPSLFARYLSSMHIQITMLNTKESPDKPGRIHPPVVQVEYKDISLEEADKGVEVEMSFSISYKMEMRETKKDIEIAVGVLSAFAVLLSAMETWSWSRR